VRIAERSLVFVLKPKLDPGTQQAHE
jgi:hypothetical protein